MSDLEKTTQPKGDEEGLTLSPTPYTVFSLTKRRVLVYLLGYLSLASSLTSNIYFPLLEVLAQRYQVSIQDINLTITLFFVFQGIAPSFWSPLSDSFGRRPVYLATFAVYTAASLGLSIADHNYVALIVLRAMQSVGGSAVLSLAYAVVSDVCIHSERGSLIAPMMAAANIGPLIGPVIGGGAALASGDPRWCFRALLIFGGSALLLIGWGMPETARTVVGNGAVPAQGIWKTWWSLPSGQDALRAFRRRGTTTSVEGKEGKASAVNQVEAEINVSATGRGRPMMPNPLPSLRLICYFDTFSILWLAASPYALWYSVQTSMTPILSTNYGLDSLNIGLCFLAGGVGILAGGFIAGRLMDLNYRHVAKAAGITTDRVRGDDMTKFPIERARSRGSISIIAVSMCVVIGYGWAVEKHAHLALLLACQLYIGCKCTTLHQIYSALVVDIFPEKPGCAAAANNITRCSLSAVLVAVLNPLIQAVGYGWVYTLLAFLDGLSSLIAVCMLRKWGKYWRDRRNNEESIDNTAR